MLYILQTISLGTPARQFWPFCLQRCGRAKRKHDQTSRSRVHFRKLGSATWFLHQGFAVYAGRLCCRSVAFQTPGALELARPSPPPPSPPPPSPPRCSLAWRLCSAAFPLACSRTSAGDDVAPTQRAQQRFRERKSAKAEGRVGVPAAAAIGAAWPKWKFGSERPGIDLPSRNRLAFRNRPHLILM